MRSNETHFDKSRGFSAGLDESPVGVKPVGGDKGECFFNLCHVLAYHPAIFAENL
jgi:hypothetical protein